GGRAEQCGTGRWGWRQHVRSGRAPAPTVHAASECIADRRRRVLRDDGNSRRLGTRIRAARQGRRASCRRRQLELREAARNGPRSGPETAAGRNRRDRLGSSWRRRRRPGRRSRCGFTAGYLLDASPDGREPHESGPPHGEWGWVGLGGLVAIVVSRSLHAVLFGITTTDWRVYGGVAAAVLMFAFLATLGPALRAGSVDPSIAMRAE